MVKALILAVVGLVTMATGLMPGSAKAYTFTDLGVGDTIGIWGGGSTDGNAAFSTYFFFSLAAPATLTDFKVTDLNNAGLPFEWMRMTLHACATTTDCAGSLYNSGLQTGLISAPDQVLAAGRYQVYVSALLRSPIPFPGTFFSNNYELSGQIVATTPIPAAVLMFGTALGSLGCFGWLRRRRSVAAAT